MLSVSATDDLIKTGIVDSLTLMKIVSFMEEHFDIRVRDEDISARNFRTLAAMDAFIEYKRSET